MCFVCAGFPARSPAVSSGPFHGPAFPASLRNAGTSVLVFELADVPGGVDFVIGEVVIVERRKERTPAASERRQGSEKRTGVRARAAVGEKRPPLGPDVAVEADETARTDCGRRSSAWNARCRAEKGSSFQAVGFSCTGKGISEQRLKRSIVLSSASCLINARLRGREASCNFSKLTRVPSGLGSIVAWPVTHGPVHIALEVAVTHVLLAGHDSAALASTLTPQGRALSAFSSSAFLAAVPERALQFTVSFGWLVIEVAQCLFACLLAQSSAGFGVPVAGRRCD